METWDQEVDCLVRKCLESATEVLNEVENDCKNNQINLTNDFVDMFYKLLEEK